jgi:hypothetical protein
VHKHPYPRSWYLKAFLPQSQTLPIVPAACATVVFAVPLRKAKAPRPAYLRAQPAGRRQPEEISDGSAPSGIVSIAVRPFPRPRPHPTNAAVLSMIAHAVGVDVECHFVTPAIGPWPKMNRNE